MNEENTMSQLRVGQKRRMRGVDSGWTYTITAIEESEWGDDAVTLISDNGTECVWFARFVLLDEVLDEVDRPPADPKNPQVGDRFRMFDRPSREYEILEVGADTVKVRYITEITWNKAYCGNDIPL